MNDRETIIVIMSVATFVTSIISFRIGYKRGWKDSKTSGVPKAKNPPPPPLC